MVARDTKIENGVGKTSEEVNEAHLEENPDENQSYGQMRKQALGLGPSRPKTTVTTSLLDIKEPIISKPSEYLAHFTKQMKHIRNHLIS